MAIRKVLECDVCGRTPADRFRIGDESHLYARDLCEIHGRPFRKILDRISQEIEGQIRAEMKPMTLEEIERLRRPRG